MAEFRLETERLVLRDWREGDAEEFFRVTNTFAVMRWLGGEMDAEGREALLARVTGCREANGFCFWIVERKRDSGHLAGEILGFCGLKRADAPGSSVTGEVEVGWRLREDAWGRGYAREAANAAIATGFTRFGARRIVALTVIGNETSWGLMERLGMQRRADLDYVDQRYDPPLRNTIVYRIDRASWESGPHGSTFG